MLFTKTKLPLSNAERLNTHMSVFTETLNNLQDLRLEIADELSTKESEVIKLRDDLADVVKAVERVKLVTG